jgi:PD-(D/E)XK nuclease superfamily
MNATTPLAPPSPLPELALRPRVALPVLSSAEKRCFQSCKRKHYIRYRLLRRPLRAPESVWLGRVLHRALAAWWRAAQEGGDRLVAALIELNPTPDDAGAEPTDPFEAAKVEALLVGYHARWAGVVVEVLAVEVEFTAPIVNPETGKESRTYALGGKIGAIARLRDGQVYVVDHRTTSESIDEGAEYWQRLRLDAQVSDTFAGARSLGYEVAGCYYDVIAKPRLAPLAATPLEKRQYTKKDGRLYAGQRESDETPYEYRTRLDEHIAEKPERYFARAVTARVGADETEALLDTWNTARDIREADLALRHPRNPDACKGWGRLCEFFAVCTGEADVNDAGMFRSAGDTRP